MSCFPVYTLYLYGGYRGAGVGGRTDTNKEDSADRITVSVLAQQCELRHSIYICIGALNTYATYMYVFGCVECICMHHICMYICEN